jgi:hypothetical protein
MILYVKRTRKDKLVGELKGSIEALLKEQCDGGSSHHPLSVTIPLIRVVLVLKRSLVILNDGNNDEVPPEVNFTISLDTLGTSALHHQTVEAMSQAKVEAAHMSTLPRSRATGTNAAGIPVDPTTDVLSLLLRKISKFNDIVQKIADVC